MLLLMTPTETESIVGLFGLTLRKYSILKNIALIKYAQKDDPNENTYNESPDISNLYWQRVDASCLW